MTTRQDRVSDELIQSIINGVSVLGENNQRSMAKELQSLRALMPKVRSALERIGDNDGKQSLPGYMCLQIARETLSFLDEITK